MKVVGGGKFKNTPEKIDPSLKFVLGLGTVDMIIIGFETNNQVNDYITRMKNMNLSE
jgi:hypothetical protein